MKIILYFLLLMLISSCEDEVKQENAAPTLNTYIIRAYDSTYSSRDTTTRKTYDIRLAVVNNLSKPVSFRTMSCSWDLNFVFNKVFVGFIREECNHNVHRIVWLNPGDSVVYSTSMVRYDYGLDTLKTVKLGLIFVDSTRTEDEYFDIVEDRSLQEKVIWSNPIYLNK